MPFSILAAEDGDSIFLRNVGIQLNDYTVEQSRIPPSLLQVSPYILIASETYCSAQWGLRIIAFIVR